jgi:AcrR family transcriptional regulator
VQVSGTLLGVSTIEANKEAVAAATAGTPEATAGTTADAAAELRPGLRERKKQETRERLHAAALDLAAQRGYPAVTVEEICQAADVSHRTFFNYYACKEDAVLGGPQPGEDTVFDRYVARPAEESPVEAAVAVLLEMSKTMSHARDEMLVRIKVFSSDPELRARGMAKGAAFERRLAEAIAERTGLDADKDMYPGLLASVVSNAYRYCVQRWAARNGRESLARIIEEALTSVAEGLPAPATTHNHVPRKDSRE